MNVEGIQGVPQPVTADNSEDTVMVNRAKNVYDVKVGSKGKPCCFICQLNMQDASVTKS